MSTKPAAEARRRSDVEQRLLELTTLHEISKVLTESLDLRVTCGKVLKLLSQMLGMARGTFMMREPGSPNLSIVAACGMTEEEVRRGRYKVGEGIVGRVVATGSPIVVPSIGDEPLFLDRTGSRAKLDRKSISFLCVPVKVGGETVGVLSADRLFEDRIPFDRDVQFLSIVAGSIAQAVRIGEMVRDEKQRLLDENLTLKSELKGRYRFDNIIGVSDRMQAVFGQVDRVSRSSATVILRGESGTGKEMIAGLIHFNSPRANGPFVKLNCAALPETLLETELFGHARGAFTGAVGEKRGRFELANGGTLFLDEVGDLPLSFQVKLLRVLQERQFERVGGTGTISVDVRLVTATNRALEDAVRSGAFREDLYYRLNVIPIFLPPLRERPEDIPPLIEHFLSRFNRENGKSVRLSRSVYERLLRYPWPGNIRELQHAIEHLVVMAEGTEAREAELPLSILNGPGLAVSPGAPLPAPASGLASSPPQEAGLSAGQTPALSAIEQAEKAMIEEALAKAEGNRSKAARVLGITPRQIGYKARKYGIGRNLLMALLCLAVLLLPAVPAWAGEVSLSAAASLKDALDEIADAYARNNPGTRFLKNYGSSGALAKQIENGAPADIFLSANIEWMEYLKERRIVAAESVGTFAFNTLVFVGAGDKGVSSIRDLPRLERIAVGSPASVPAGKYAAEALARAGIGRQLEKKLVMARDVRECLLYAEREEADGAFVYRTDALLAKRARILFEVPQELYPRVTYPFALTAAGANNGDAVRFYGYLGSEAARAALVRHGFSLK
ncbi:MAG: nif-specific transcriptional activator NifA [Thermodesulfobacteriota bacterium]